MRLMLGLVGVFLAVVFLFWLHNTWVDYRLQASLGASSMVKKRFGASNIDEITPQLSQPGEIIWLEGRDYPDLWEIPALKRPYCVRFDPAAKPIMVNGVADSDAVGLLGYMGLDRRLDYSISDNSVITFDPTNGAVSAGDIICIFNDRVPPDAPGNK